MHGVKRTALAFDRACKAADVQYVFIGGIAVMAWGQPRATTDVGTMVRLDRDLIDRFADALKEQGLDVSVKDFVDALEDTSHVTVFDSETAFHVDVKIATKSEEPAEISDAVVVSLAGGEVNVARAEDVIAFKLSFGSAQDLQDARSILSRQADDLDHDRLRQTAIRLKVESVLDVLLSET